MYQTTLVIDGMACGMCESHVNDAVRGAMKVKKVTSSYKTGKSVILSDEPPEADTVQKAVEATGYRVLSCETVPYEKKGLFHFGRG